MKNKSRARVVRVGQALHLRRQSLLEEFGLCNGTAFETNDPLSKRARTPGPESCSFTCRTKKECWLHALTFESEEILCVMASRIILIFQFGHCDDEQKKILVKCETEVGLVLLTRSRSRGSGMNFGACRAGIQNPQHMLRIAAFTLFFF